MPAVTTAVPDAPDAAPHVHELPVTALAGGQVVTTVTAIAVW